MKRELVCIAAVLLLGLALCPMASATAQHEVYVWVYDNDTLEPAEGAVIEVHDYESALLIEEYQANETGMAVMSLMSGDYLIKAVDGEKVSEFRLVLTDEDTDTTISIPMYSQSDPLIEGVEDQPASYVYIGIIALLLVFVVILLFTRRN